MTAAATVDTYTPEDMVGPIANSTGYIFPGEFFRPTGPPLLRFSTSCFGSVLLNWSTELCILHAGFFYTATMTGLEAGQMYDYQVGSKPASARCPLHACHRCSRLPSVQCSLSSSVLSGCVSSASAVFALQLLDPSAGAGACSRPTPRRSPSRTRSRTLSRTPSRPPPRQPSRSHTPSPPTARRRPRPTASRASAPCGRSWRRPPRTPPSRSLLCGPLLR